VADVARAAFSRRERVRIESLPEPARLRAFYEAWTRKEASLKAVGCGLDQLATVDEGRFWLHAFEPAPGYVGAVAATDGSWTARHLSWRWEELPAIS
jgi:4'-phosphopantetheinyl transferase